MQVTRTDSVAGVSLRYGVSLADLRRANRLLASDTIHLRKELYIPLHLSEKKFMFLNLEVCLIKPIRHTKVFMEHFDRRNPQHATVPRTMQSKRKDPQHLLNSPSPSNVFPHPN